MPNLAEIVDRAKAQYIGHGQVLQQEFPKFKNEALASGKLFRRIVTKLLDQAKQDEQDRMEHAFTTFVDDATYEAGDIAISAPADNPGTSSADEVLFDVGDPGTKSQGIQDFFVRSTNARLNYANNLGKLLSERLGAPVYRYRVGPHNLLRQQPPVDWFVSREACLEVCRYELQAWNQLGDVLREQHGNTVNLQHLLLTWMKVLGGPDSFSVTRAAVQGGDTGQGSRVGTAHESEVGTPTNVPAEAGAIRLVGSDDLTVFDRPSPEEEDRLVAEQMRGFDPQDAHRIGR